MGLKDFWFKREKLEEEEAKKKIAELLQQCPEIEEAYLDGGHRAIVILEGWDCAGKSGIAHRLQHGFTAEVCRVWHVTKPPEDEVNMPYLFRFWKRLPSPGNLVVFDRSWYGRVVIEPLEGLASRTDQERAYDEINQFEKMLAISGIKVIKVFLHFEKNSMAERFKAKIYKNNAHTLSKNDFLTYERYTEYEDAFSEMLLKTNAAAAWKVIEATDRNWVRVETIKYILQELRKGIDIKQPLIPIEALCNLAKHFRDDARQNEHIMEEAKKRYDELQEGEEKEHLKYLLAG